MNSLNKVSPEEQDRNVQIGIVLFLLAFVLIFCWYGYQHHQQNKPKTPTEELIIENNKYIVK